MHRSTQPDRSVRGIHAAPALLVLAAVFATDAHAQTYVNNVADIPQGAPFNNSFSENVDFGDVDLDGDFDAVFADGGDIGNDQNRIWINQGFLQAGTPGAFVDETATRFPALADPSRDLEFVDFDSDGDLDLYASNSASFFNASNTFVTNQGGLQAGTIGFFVDETSTRWIGLGGPGSSIAPGQVLGGGGYIDFSADSDFADLDNDGDLDLVHSSYGSVFNGLVPTRLFLNDGLGFFTELNPSGFQLPGQTISNGSPGLWCEGLQQQNTTDATGAQCDIATTALDIDLGDIDGDNDFDILHGARGEETRLFQNRLEETGSLIFRDVSHAAFPAGWSPGAAHYEQEMGDFDGDGDLDILGVNWSSGFSFFDNTYENDGAGTFSDMTSLPGSSQNDIEGDVFDHDNDGDLDLFLTAFDAAHRIYQNDNDGGADFSFTLLSGELSPANVGDGLDTDLADLDNDGDTDLMVSHDNGQANALYENTSGLADTHAPALFHLDQAPHRSPGAEPTVVRVQVYDNASYYVTWYNDTRLEVTVNGGPSFEVPMVSSGGQIFRGELPGNLVGQVCYRALSTDREGNTGASAQLCFHSVPPSFCDGADGSLASCPCSNPGAPDTGCDIQQATGGVKLDVLAQETSPLNRATLQGTGFPAMSTPTAIVIRAPALDPGSPIVFGDGLRCIGVPLVRLGAAFANGGSSVHTFGHGVMAGAGDAHYQLWFRNTPVMFCDPTAAFNLSGGRSLLW